jgi:PAT family beta-lactamase induction signal transducer AmpG
MLVQCLLIVGYFFANLYQSALGGWLSSITSEERKNALSSWVTIANVCGSGVAAIVTGELMQNLAPDIAAGLLGLIVLLPTAIFFFMPAPGPDRRLARDSFTQFFGEVFSLLKRREVLIAIVLFVAPAATFSLTNFLSDVGEDYHASSRLVSLVGGVGIIAGGLGGGLLFRLVDRLLPLRFLYLAVGVVGSLFTLALIALPRTPTFYGIAFLGENIFQGLAITTSIAIAFETIGHRNPLAATVYCLVTSAFNIPIFYMQLIDGWGYGKQGVAGSFAADAVIGIIASVLLTALLIRLGRKPAVAAPFRPH